MSKVSRQAAQGNPALPRGVQPFLIGQYVSTWGTAVTQFALPLLVLRLTHSPLSLGLTAAAGLLPSLLFAPLFGVLSDRVDRQRAVTRIELLRALCVLLVPVLWAAHALLVWHVYALAFVQGTLSAGYFSLAPALMPRLVPRESLAVCNARLNAGAAVGRALGPVAGAALLAVVSLPLLVLLDAVSFAVSAWTLHRLGLRPAPREAARGGTGGAREGYLASARAGLAYIASDDLLRRLLLLTAAGNLLIGAVNPEIVYFLTDGLHLSERGVGVFMTVSALGGVLASRCARRAEQRWGAGPLLRGSLLAYGASTAGLGLATGWPAALLCSAIAAAATLFFNTVIATARQLGTPDAVLGRVMSVTAVASWSCSGVGALVAGGTVGLLGGAGPAFVLAGLLFMTLPLLVRSHALSLRTT